STTELHPQLYVSYPQPPSLARANRFHVAGFRLPGKCPSHFPPAVCSRHLLPHPPPDNPHAPGLYRRPPRVRGTEVARSACATNHAVFSSPPPGRPHPGGPRREE